MENIVLYVIAGLVIFLVLFFILRELNNWYWKINKRIALQEETNNLLRQILQKSTTKEVLPDKKEIHPVQSSSNSTNDSIGNNLVDDPQDREPVLIQNIKTGERKYVAKFEWKKMIQSGESNSYTLIQ